ncbi:hypothetical protein [Marivita cryptomonadis]|uniref:hypothetical protein n=1 Tax=Marivita cryptomonadis TaxID=505252 RepID=UPI00111C781A|nr:hypothetical protein [Marivita cryptomonadis]
MTNTIDTLAANMPDTITAEGKTFYRTKYTGTSLPACPFGPGHTTHEYWIGTDDDSLRLYAISPTQFWID